MHGRSVTARRRVFLTTLVVGLGLLLSGCAKNAPQDTLKPEGPLARKIDDLFAWPFWIAVVIFFLVEGLIVLALFRFRYREGGPDAPRQLHGNTRLEVGLTVAPALILAVLAIPTVGTILDLAEEPKNAMRIDVIGHQWWWEYKYPDSGVVTATDLHIPINTPVFLRMTSADVIHAFWIPKLNGKRDVIPGRIQTLRLFAEKPGTYLGQCTEFCGDSHANMRQRAIAQTRADFDRWVAAQKRAPRPPADDSDAGTGLGLFTAKGCAGCHTIQGVSKGRVGPDLTHVASRTTFAGGIFATNARNLAIWLRDPPGEKPGSIMPNLHLSESEISSLVAYLETLK